MKGIISIALLGAIVATTACDPNLTGTLSGFVAVGVADDPTFPTRWEPDPDPDPGSTVQQERDTFTGVFEATAEIDIMRTGSGWVTVRSAEPISTPLQSEHEWMDLQGRGGLPLGTYTRARVTLSGARAALAAGSVFGGRVVPEDTVLRVGNGEPFVIEKDIDPFTLSGRTRVRLVFDLNAQDWLDAASLDEGEVEESRVREATLALRVIEPR